MRLYGVTSGAEMRSRVRSRGSGPLNNFAVFVIRLQRGPEEVQRDESYKKKGCKGAMRQQVKKRKKKVRKCKKREKEVNG